MDRPDRMLKDAPVDADGVPIEPLRLTPGFIAFVSLMCLPAIVALVIFFGAWMVSSEVYAAEDAADQPASSSFGRPSEPGNEVAGWKRTLVGICPVH
jgi:hypothetical protein